MAELEANQRRGRCLTILLRASILLASVVAWPVSANVPGAQLPVNTFTPGNQRDAAIAIDAAGNFVVVWAGDFDQDGSERGIFAQGFDASGQPRGAEFQVNTFTDGDQFDPAVGMDGAGNFVVAWTSGANQDGGGFGIFAQRYDASGQPIGGEFPVNTTTAGNQSSPAVAMNATGDLVIAWTSALVDPPQHVFAQRYDSDGTPLGPEAEVTTAPGDVFDRPAIAIDANGNFVIAWASNAANSSAISVVVRRFDSNGIPFANEASVNTSGSGRRPSVGMNGVGDFTVAWQATDGIVARRYAADGAAAGPEFQVNSFSFFPERPALAMGSAGDFVVTWFGFDLNDNTLIAAQRYDAAGVAQGDEFKVDDLLPTASRSAPATAMDPAGTFVIAWTARDASGDGIFARQYAAAATPALSLSIGDVSVAEGHTGFTDATFTVALSAVSAEPVSVQFATSDGTAGAGADYQPATGMLTFEPGELTKQVTVHVFGDTLAEPDERFFLTLTNPSANATIARGRGIGSILNDDFALSVSDATPVVEGGAGTTAAIFSVTLSDVSPHQVMVNFATADGTATLADNDYAAASGTLVFAPGETTKQVSIQINGDTQNEFDETFSITLSSPTNAALADAQGLGVIRNDDFGTAIAGNQFRVNSAFFGSQYQPSVGMNASGASVVVWTSQVPDATGFLGTTGIFARRFDARGIIQGPEFRVDNPAFATGQNRQPAVAMDHAGDFVVVWAGGTVSGGLESDFVSSEVYAQRFDANGTPQGTNFVVNGNGSSFSAGPQQHPSVGMYGSGEFVVAWDGPGGGSPSGVFAQAFDAGGTRVGTEARVDTSTRAGNPRVAVNPSVCSPPPGPPLPGGCTLPDAVIVWAGAGPDDDAGIVARRFSGGSGLPQGNQFQLNRYVDNVQERPAVDMDASGAFVVAWEGEGPGAVRGIFAQRVDGSGNLLGWCATSVPGTSCLIDERQIDTGTTGARRAAVGVGAHGDFVIGWDGIQAPPSPITSVNRAIFARAFDRFGTSIGGAAFLVNQTFPLGEFDPDVRMDAGGNFLIAWVGTDASVDGVFARRFTATPAVSIGDAVVLEGDAGTTTATFTVTLSTPSIDPVAVAFATADGTTASSATVADNDYLARTDTVNFSPGQTTQTIAITVNGDTTAEPDESFAVNLTNAVNAVVGRSQGVGTILNDDCALSINDVTVTEPDAGTAAAVFTVSLPCPRGQTVTVEFATADGSATAADNDYTPQSGTLAFLAGETVQTISVSVNGDTAVEADETFTVNLANPTNVSIAKAQGVGTIADDDPVQIVVNETIAVSDTAAVLPAAVIAVSENITVADAVETAVFGPDLFTSKSLFLTESNLQNGDAVAYKLVVANAAGPRVASTSGPITVTDTLDSRLEFASEGSDPRCQAAGQVVTCVDTGPLNPHDVLIFVVAARVRRDAAGFDETVSIQNRITAATPGETNTADNESNIVTITVFGPPRPDIVAHKTLESPALVQNGDLVLYELAAVLRNGPTVGPITVTDTLDPRLSFVAAESDPRCHAAAQVVTCVETRVLAAHLDSARFTISARVASDAAGLAQTAIIENRMTAATPDEMNTSDNVSNSVTLIVEGSEIDAFTAAVGRNGTLTTDPSGAGATSSDPITTSVTTPVPGTVSITERPVDRSREPGFNVLGFEVSIAAPDGTAESPLIIVFELDASVLPRGSTPGDVLIRRNGILVADCVSPVSGAASPDPCVRAREALPNGNARITVLTSRASVWGFLTPNRPPTVTVPDGIIVEATGPEGASVTYVTSADDLEDGALTPACTPASGSTFRFGVTTVSCNVEDSHGASANGSFTVTVRDTIPPVVTLTSPADAARYLLREVVTAAYDCEDTAAGIATCNGPVSSGSNIATGVVGTHTFAVHAADRAGNVAQALAQYRVVYGIRLLYDPAKTKRSGSTIPIKLQLTDVDGRNESSASVTLTALDVILAAATDTGQAEDAGNANPDDRFRYDASMDGGGYLFNLKTVGYRMGTYYIRFRAGDDPTVYVAEFRVR